MTKKIIYFNNHMVVKFIFILIILNQHIFFIIEFLIKI